MSSVESTNEQHLDAFYTAFNERKGSVAAQFAQRLREHLPPFVVPDNDVDALAREMVEQFLDAVVDPAARKLREATPAWIGRMFARGLPASNVHALSAGVRDVLLDVGLELQAAGVPRATDGIRRLIAASRVSVQMIDDAFRERTREALQMATVFEALFQAAPHGIAVASPDGILRLVNPYFHQLLGMTDLVGRSVASVHVPSDLPRVQQEVKPSVSDTGHWQGTLWYKHADGSTVETHATAFRLKSTDGRIVGRCAIVREVGAARRAEEERRRLMEEVIAAQQRALEERETPLVPIADGVLVMPLVGNIDAVRAERMLVALLQGIEEQRAAVVLLDLTGVRTVDQESVNAIVRATQAARLLGTDVVLTGIEPNVARMFVEMNANFSGLEMKSTLGDGVRWALRKRKPK